MKQNYSFRISESLIAENAGIPLKELHFDVDAILKAYEGIKPLAEELGVEPPRPRIAGFGYAHLASLGSPVRFAEDGEPKVFPMVSTPRDIETLGEPDDYLSAPLIRTRLRIAEAIGNRCGNALTGTIGHLLQGPVTTAVLMMGQDFFLLPYDYPESAHRLLNFCTESALNYAKALNKHFLGIAEPSSGPRGIPDDFAGMFPPELFMEFVVPYWRRIYDGMRATKRNLHSELLREEHMPFLSDAGINYFDPGVDQYLTPGILKRSCPCPFKLVIKSWEMRDMNPAQLESLYREYSAYKPYVISFHMSDIKWKPRVKRLLGLARELSGTGEKAESGG